jgi:hypothetical protein
MAHDLPPLPAPQNPLRALNDRLEIPALSGAEPEEKPVVRVAELGKMSLTLGGQPLTGQVKDRTLPGAVAQDLGSAGAVADALLERCEWCRHWDTAEGARKIEASYAEVTKGRPPGQVHQIMRNLHAVGRMGYCRPLSAAMGRDFVTAAASDCTGQNCRLITPSGENVRDLRLFQIRDRVTDRRGVVGHDKIMQLAQGKL